MQQSVAQITLQPIVPSPLSEKPLVSVLMANYNYARFLGEAIESVLNQTYQNFELIVCDDGSTDDSCGVVLAYAARDPRIRLLQQPNLGQSAALNAAYRESQGEVISLLDADDRFLPEKLETIVHTFCAKPDCGFLAHRIFLFDDKGRRTCVLPLLWEPPSGWFGDSIIRDGDPPPGLVPTSGLCLRREVVDMVWPLPERLQYGSDAAVVSLAPLTTRLIGVPVPLSEYRCHGQNGVFSSQVTEKTYARQRDFCRASWQVQHEYLNRIHPHLAKALLPLERRMAFQLASYMHMRITKNAEALSAYRRLLRTSRFASAPLAIRWFWRASILLPLPLLRWAVEFLWGQRNGGILRHLSFRIMGVGRSGKAFRPEPSLGGLV